jgi:hypothetical protein
MLGLAALPGISARAAPAATPVPAEASGCRDGYRRLGALRDFALGNAWTVYANCAHPEMPRLAVADGGQSESGWPEPAFPARSRAAPAAAAPVVAAGAQVRLWKRDGVAAIDLQGAALESGAAGARIRVRVAPGGKVLRGTVRGPGSVELDARAVPGFSGEGR